MKLQANLTIAAAILTPSNNHLPTPSKLPSRHLLPATGMRDPFVKADSSPVKLAQVSTPKIAGYALLKSIDKLIDFAFSAISLPGADAAIIDLSASSIEAASYNKGDKARTVEDFAYQLRDEFVVFANKKALDPENFTKKNAIFIYTEIHTTPMIPSLRTEPGSFLTEPPVSHRCLEKHKLHPDNICKNIDIAGTTNSEIKNAHDEFYHYARILIQFLDVAEHNKLEEIVNNLHETLMFPHLHERMFSFLDQRYQNILATKHPLEQKVLESLYRTVDSSWSEYQAVLVRTMDTRDRGMISEAKKWINAQGEGAGTTVLVGAAHGLAIAKGLEQAYPDRALVLCIRKDFVYSTYQEQKAFKSDLTNSNLEIVPPLPPKKPDGEL